ncbi:hypothetical protein FC959_05605 [Clostridium botulinum]|nr:hypothetical protein [Clostridium botulinum]
MCVKNSSIITKYMNSAHNDIVTLLHEFENAKNEFEIIEVPVVYFLLYGSLTKEKIYDSLHILLNDNIVVKKTYIQCPYCLNEQLIDFENGITRCKRCKEYIDYDNTLIEKFELRK